MWISSKQMCPINLVSDGIPDAFSRSDTIFEIIPGTISDSIIDSNSEANPGPNSDHSHCSTLLQEGGLQ